MKNLFSFECRKFIQRKKNLIGVLVFAAILFGFVILSTSLEEQYRVSELQNCGDQIDSIKAEIKNLEASQPDSELYTAALSTERSLLKLYEKREMSLRSGDWKAVLQTRIEENNMFIDGVESGLLSGESPDVLRAQNCKYQYLLDHNIPPIFENCTMQSFNFLRVVMNDFSPLLLIMLLFILTSDMLSSEADEGTFRLLLTQPVSRGKILFAKYLASFTMCLLSVLAVFTVFFVGLGVFRGFGSPLYPTDMAAGSFGFSQPSVS